MNTLAEENLREAACVGDLQTVKNLISQNVNVNSKNSINGWTPLHWACKRGHLDTVKYLIAHGADCSIKNSKDETPANVCTNATILSMFGMQKNENYNREPKLNFVPNYIKNPPLNPKINVEFNYNTENIPKKPILESPEAKEKPLLLLVRIADCIDQDYRVIEIPQTKLTYQYVFQECCKKLKVFSFEVLKLRHPFILLRNDNDFKRLSNESKLELVLRD